MSAEAYRKEEMYRKNEPELISIKRNPYLVDYEQQRRLRENRTPQQRQGVQRSQRTPQRVQEGVREREVRRVPQETVRREQGMRPKQEIRRVPRSAPQRKQEMQWEQEVRRAPQRISRTETVRRRNIDQYQDEILSPAQRKRAIMEKKRAAARRKRIVRMQRMVLFAGVFCIAMLCGILFMKRIDAKAELPDNKDSQQKVADDILPVASSSLIQGLPAAEFAKHPEWEENFLTPNEYSRPGDALEEVNNIFVHYTANPNTSAAQNRSYFEQLKDTHITSASAHFIIGYNGEIVQCIPLDEIAYAVQTRNFDSISIECCYKSTDGSFTQETYDSLIELLAWLTDIYDLETDDILRHYDCGGKKCPIYYTQHEDAWIRLKQDVEEKL